MPYYTTPIISESDVDKVVAVVNKYSKHGNEFAKTLVSNNPKIVEIYPALNRIVKKGPAKTSDGREAYNNDGINAIYIYNDKLIYLNNEKLLNVKNIANMNCFLLLIVVLSFANV